MSKLRLGIVGSGMIAGVIANAVRQVESIELVAVASRRPISAKAFAEEHGIDQVFDTWQEMLASSVIDAIYVATPTASKEEIAIYGAQNKKHLLVDKPFASFESLENIIKAAKANAVSFMDATHFTHNPRTKTLNNLMQEEIGAPQAVRTSFFFPFMDRNNIRFNIEKEPTGAVGDMTWYSMRAIAEYLKPTVPVKTVSGGIVRDEETNAVIRGSGVLVFEDGKSSTFDFGYNAGTCLMDLDVLGHEGVFSMSDFVLDWKNGFAFDNQEHVIGFTKRTGMQLPKEHKYIEADSSFPQSVYMMKNFADLTANAKSKENVQAQHLALLTQQLLDKYWEAVA
ncbi:Gfo/Idh/MocA family oxidoreductase [Aliikangiella marina]|uniref:Gfo/Idh/MocA family oxidoreductase n=1 Tax=Aliikangiella marina TaxID=1712262 RepID=A0A545T9L9_9GAMM|nr:Gfo/Idh/MocA family oxidoreductase [Aliikangiella marina]TQV73906.1 Gfo/Idh/MocA family oxidoreductase [Aliikangiella marina]